MTTSLVLSSCGGGSSNNSAIEEGDNTNQITDEANNLPVDLSLFALDGFSATEVDCTLSNGTSTSCYQITVAGFPADRTSLGPYCPQSITTEADDAGVWFDDGVLYDLTGEFIANLDTFYNDETWQMFDESTGRINVTTTQEGCEAAAQPNVPAEWNNYCVECDIDYFKDEDSNGVSLTVTLPKTPVTLSSPESIGNAGVGIALNGVKLEGAAPVAAILGGYTIAAFDDCVGHVNPFVGYHYHGANHGNGTCPGIDFEGDGHGGLIGYALDGFGIYAMLDEDGNESTDLDVCRGHTDDIRGYHYHSAGPGENAFIGCFSGATVQ